MPFHSIQCGFSASCVFSLRSEQWAGLHKSNGFPFKVHESTGHVCVLRGVRLQHQTTGCTNIGRTGWQCMPVRTFELRKDWRCVEKIIDKNLLTLFIKKWGNVTERHLTCTVGQRFCAKTTSINCRKCEQWCTFCSDLQKWYFLNNNNNKKKVTCETSLVCMQQEPPRKSR